MFKQLLQLNAIQFCQIDSCRLAGPNEILAVYLMAAKFGGQYMESSRWLDINVFELYMTVFRINRTLMQPVNFARWSQWMSLLIERRHFFQCTSHGFTCVWCENVKRNNAIINQPVNSLKVCSRYDSGCFWLYKDSYSIKNTVSERRLKTGGQIKWNLATMLFWSIRKCKVTWTYLFCCVCQSHICDRWFLQSVIIPVDWSWCWIRLLDLLVLAYFWCIYKLFTARRMR